MGVAIVKEVGNIPYLDKFAVARFRQGTGLGKSIWAKLIKENPKLVWRASLGNQVNKFYSKNCDGMIKKSSWIVYWINLDDEEILPTVELVAGKPKNSHMGMI